MKVVIDETSGTGATNQRVPFSGKRHALVLAIFTGGDKTLNDGFAQAAQGLAVGALEDAGFEVCSARACRILEAPEGKDAFLDFALHVGTVEEDDA